MNGIDNDLLNSLQTISKCYNDLLFKYQKLETKYFSTQINLSLIKSNIDDLTYIDDKQLEILNRINNLIMESFDNLYIKGDNNDNSSNSN